jgi:hypothetical protein
MRALIALLLLTGCVSQEEIDAQNFRKDRFTCESYGVYFGDTRFESCMHRVALMRAQTESANTGAALSVLGIGAGLYQSSIPTAPPPPRPVICNQTTFNSVTCQ